MTMNRRGMEYEIYNWLHDFEVKHYPRFLKSKNTFYRIHCSDIETKMVNFDFILKSKEGFHKGHFMTLLRRLRLNENDYLVFVVGFEHRFKNKPSPYDENPVCESRYITVKEDGSYVVKE